MAQYAGIDYSFGKSNVDQTGIHYGVISHNNVGQAWYDNSEGYFGEAHCPECGNDRLVEIRGQKYIEKYKQYGYHAYDLACKECKITLNHEDCFPESPISFYIDDEEYSAEQGGDDTDIFITKSPYYTYCQFCSPCAPGAGYLMNPYVRGLKPVNDDEDEEGKAYQEEAEQAGFIKAFCFGHDWFEEEKAPYPVFSVETGELVNP